MHCYNFKPLFSNIQRNSLGVIDKKLYSKYPKEEIMVYDDGTLQLITGKTSDFLEKFIDNMNGEGIHNEDMEYYETI